MTLLTEPTPAVPTEMATSDWIDAPDGKLYELIDGKPVEKRVSATSMWIATNISYLLNIFVQAHDSGFVFVEQPVLGIWQRPRHGRRPDVCFVSKARLPVLPSDGELEVAPDLAIEVVSPHDNASYLETKTVEYLTAGVQLVWVVVPEAKAVRVLRRDGTGGMFNLTQTLDGGDVLPGFTCRVADIFPKS